MVKCPLMVELVMGSIPPCLSHMTALHHNADHRISHFMGPIELFLDPASTPQLV